jgi:excisionase family DNA binding protein
MNPALALVPPPAFEPLLTPADVAARLSISRSEVYVLVRKAELPALRIGNQIRIRPADLEAFLAAAARPRP